MEFLPILIICIVAALAAGVAAGIFLGIKIRKNTAEKEIGSAEDEAKRSNSARGQGRGSQVPQRE